MRKLLCSLIAVGFLLSATAQVKTPGKLPTPSSAVLLPNGWTLNPAGRSFELGDLPLNMAVSNSKKWMAVTNNGQSTQSIQLIDTKNEKVVDEVTIAKAWYGLAFSQDDKSLFVSGGNDNWILQYAIGQNKLQLIDSFKLGKKWPTRISPAGIALDEKNNKLYVVTKENNSLYMLDLKSHEVLKQVSIGAEGYACVLSTDKKSLYVSVWGGDKVLFIDPTTLETRNSIAVGDNPNELLLNKAGNILYVANANDNSVSVIDVKQQKVIEVLNAALYPDAPAGSASNGLALSENGKTLYVANADNNAVAVFDVSEKGAAVAKGFIPVGWYPTNIKVVGRKIFVTNGKGLQSMANPYGPNPAQKKEEVVYQQGDINKKVKTQYIAGLFKGAMSVVDEPTEAILKQYTSTVYKNTPYTKEKELHAEGEQGNPIPKKVGGPSPIKYVFYVVKENRTYDQVLSDLPGGNGDTSLLLFGRKITPNQHKLAEEFVLLDNFYVDAEVSADGHNWSLSANATDYLEKTWPTNYGGRGGVYDAEGNRPIANPKKGFIWEYCKRAGLSFRTYGEFADNYKPNIPVLEGNYCKSYTSWDEKVRDTSRFYQWKKDFDSLFAIGKVPQFNTLRLINDHTEGMRIGAPTPFAHVADNDLAVGMFVEYLSKSPIWKETAIFILEDDAQNGPDHVDAHRSTAYVAGGFVKRGFVDHTMYSTSSMLRTMELILGLPPMSQYDAAATPMWRCFEKTPNLTPFNSVPAQVNLNDKNTKNTPSARLSATFNFTKEDAVPDLVFSEVIWKAVKGEDSVMPAPRHSAFVRIIEKEDD
jgi:YVTN family beta-propeller protein